MNKSSGRRIQDSEHRQCDCYEVYAHGKGDRSLDGFDRSIAQPLQIRQFGSVVIHQSNIGGIYGNVTAHRTHRNTDIGHLQCRSVIDSVSDHTYLAVALEKGNILHLFLREQIRPYLRDPDSGSEVFRRLAVVSRQKDSLRIHLPEPFYHIRSFRPDRIRQSDNAYQFCAV